MRLTILILLFVSAQVVAQLPTLPADTRLLHIPILEIQIGEDKFYFEIDLLGAEDLSSFALTGAAGIDIQTYDRDDWPHWKDFDGDCQNTRHELLIAESLWNVTFTSESNCTTNTGIWVGPYTGEVFTFASDVDIDHVIPLKYAHDHGGNIQSRFVKQLFANDPENLLIVKDNENQSKGADAPSEYLPIESYQCEYASKWDFLASKYDLGLGVEDITSIDQILADCDSF